MSFLKKQREILRSIWQDATLPLENKNRSDENGYIIIRPHIHSRKKNIRHNYVNPNQVREKARAAQKHWYRKKKEMLDELKKCDCTENENRFAAQMQHAINKNKKNQLICFLLFLQISFLRGYIHAVFTNKNETKQFGWKSFTVKTNFKTEFANFFVSICPIDTVQHTRNQIISRFGMAPMPKVKTSGQCKWAHAYQVFCVAIFAHFLHY